MARRKRSSEVAQIPEMDRHLDHPIIQQPRLPQGENDQNRPLESFNARGSPALPLAPSQQHVDDSSIRMARNDVDEHGQPQQTAEAREHSHEPGPSLQQQRQVHNGSRDRFIDDRKVSVEI